MNKHSLRRISSSAMVALIFSIATSFPALAETYWNEPISASGTDTVTTSMGVVGATIEDLNNNTIEVIQMVSPSAFPTQYKIDDRVTFKETQGSSYEVRFDTAVDFPVVAVGSLGNGSTANRFTLGSVTGGSGVGDMNVVFADAWGSAGGAEGDGTVGVTTSYGPDTYGTSGGIGTETNGANLTGVTFYESKEGFIVARINKQGVTAFQFSLSNDENYMTLMMGYDSEADPAQSTITASPSTVYADGSTASTITVQVIDTASNTNTLGGETVVVSSSIGTVSNTADNGDGTYTATVISTATGSATISASLNGVTITDTAMVTFTNVPPALASSSPSDNATDVALGTNIVLTFSEAVDAESGNIVLKKSSDDSTVQSFDVTSDILGAGTTTITINPSSELEESTGYYLLIDGSAFDDTDGASYAGISAASGLNFSTAADSIAPTIVITAAEGSDGFTSDDANLSLTFTSNEATSNFTAGDISVLNGAISNFSADSGLVYTATLTPTTTGPVTVDVAAGTFTDAASNNNIAATQFNWTYGADPAVKTDVTGTIEATTNSVIRFSHMSLKNIGWRFDWLRRNEASTEKSIQGVAVNFTDPVLEQLINGQARTVEQFELASAPELAKAAATNLDATLSDAQVLPVELAMGEAKAAMGDVNLNPTSGPVYKDWSIWTAGIITVGDATLSGSSVNTESESFLLAVGVDKPIGDDRLLGYALNIGKDDATIGSAGTYVKSDNYSLAAYTGFEAPNELPVELTLGVGYMGMDMRRIDGSQTLTGNRNAKMIFASAKVRRATINVDNASISPYASVEAASMRLEGYSESGGDLALDYHEQRVNRLLAAVGFDTHWDMVVKGGTLHPFTGLQYKVDMSGSSDARMNYVGNSRVYQMTLEPTANEHWSGHIGLDYVHRQTGMSSMLMYEREQMLGAGHSDSLQIKVSVPL